MRMRITPKALHRRLQQLARQSNPVNLVQCMEHVGQAVRRDIIRSFSEQRSPEIIGPEYVQDKARSRWAPLAESTVKAKRRRGRYTRGRKRTRHTRGLAGRLRTLVDTETLRNRITYTVSRERGGVIVRIGTGVHYGKYHQTGTKRMPARPFIGTSRATLAKAALRILSRITKR